MTKHIFITGGVVSSLGKGLTAASLGMLLEARGIAIRMQKLDPYLNIDPGTMSPYQHGEVYVLDDGSETDLDLGHYERFTNSPLTKNSSWTSGRIYRNVLHRERKGKYRGKTVQVIPHITDEIKRAIHSLRSDGVNGGVNGDRNGERVDVVLTEIGGTVGDIESLPFLEAIRQFALDVGRGNCLFLHMTLIPFLKSSSELKTKPTQHSVGRLRQIGIQPDILVCRTEHSISDAERDKIALFCNMERRNVIEAKDAEFSIYEVPVMLQQNGLDQRVVDFFGIQDGRQQQTGDGRRQTADGSRGATAPLASAANCRLPSAVSLTAWHDILDRLRNPQHEVTIAVVGKYAKHRDAYKSIYEALDHAGIKHRVKIHAVGISCNKLDPAKLENVDGILVTDGLGDDVTEGKVAATRFAREQKIPFFGIDCGIMCAAYEFVRNVLGAREDTIVRIADPRRGAREVELSPESKAFACYGKQEGISERYHCQTVLGGIGGFDDHKKLQDAGLLIASMDSCGRTVNVIELPDHPWFVAVQFHPEFKSQPTRPHPLFSGFVEAVVSHQQ